MCAVACGWPLWPLLQAFGVGLVGRDSDWRLATPKAEAQSRTQHQIGSQHSGPQRRQHMRNYSMSPRNTYLHGRRDCANNLTSIDNGQCDRWADARVGEYIPEYSKNTETTHRKQI